VTVPLQAFPGQKPAALALALLTLAGCSALPEPGEIPVALDAVCKDILVQDYTVRSTITVSHRQTQEQYFLAINTGKGHRELSLISLQGLPVYRLQCSGGKARGLRLTEIARALAPERVVQYLSTAYLPDAAPDSLRAGWTRDREDQQTIRYRYSPEAGVTRTITVNSKGAGPWFDSVSVADDGAGVHLSLTTLESLRVLPE